MNLFSKFSKLNIIIFAFLILISGVLGYLFYNSNKTNAENTELIKQTKAENLDLSQDLEIVKDKYDKLKTEVNTLKSKVAKVSYRKKVNKIKSNISSAGKSSKNKLYYKKNKVSYKTLYFRLKKQCSKHNYKNSKR
ncbi:MAG: hypothetical protein IPG09_14090 [Ignavibacteria bacterium]|nr:hypothetical protein [Ignavibacteria bacterium]MBK8380837.1 hypothetical protein [Ignavibacteria bacterium]MBK9405803.1 hypothetical protein [Ignavibacteria bacterium]